MQNFFLLLVLVVIGATLAQDDLSDIFRSDDHLAEPVLPNPVFADNLEWENSQSPNSDLIDWDTANGDTLLPQDNTNIIAGSDDSRLSLSHEDEPDAAFLSAAGCPSPKTLNQREERSICPSSELTVPHVPTMDDLTNEILYSTDEHGQESPSGVYIFNDRRAKDENYCPPYRPFFLCCYCNARLDWQYCQDCLPSTSPSFFSFHLCHNRDTKRPLTARALAHRGETLK